MKRRVILLGILSLSALPAAADLKVGIRNQLSEAGRVPNSRPQDGATAGQFESAAITNGGGPATNGSLQLQRSLMGSSFALGVPDFSFGDEITPPENHPTIASWRAAPVGSGEAIRIADPNDPANTLSVTPLPEDTVPRYYYSKHAESVFASEPGAVQVVWRSQLADAQGRFTLETRDYIVSIVPRRQIRRLFWTEVPFSGPPVILPPGIEAAHIAYRERFRPTEGSTQNTDGSFRENRTLWVDQQVNSNTLRAHQVEGRLLIEFLGAERDASTRARQSLGTEIVDVLSEPVPNSTSFTVDTFLGDRVLPSNRDANLVAEVRRGVAITPPFIANRPINDAPAYFAERTTSNPNDVVIFWKEAGLLGTEWPVFRNTYNLIWPDDPALFVLNALPLNGDSTLTPINVFNENNPNLVFQDTQGEAEIDTGNFEVTPGPDGRNQSLLLLQSGRDFWYLRVLSATHDQFASFAPELRADFTATVEVGQRLTPPPEFGEDLSRAGYVLASRGDAYDPTAYLDPIARGFDAAELDSEIIGVNQLPGNDQLTVWWFREIVPPTPDFKPLHWPGVVATYTLRWPDEERQREIVMASNAGTGELTSNEAQGSIYLQNDPSLPGYNPNEEHAIMLAGRAYALRDDLNVSDVSSDPWILVRYAAPDRRPAVSVFRVLREKDVNDDGDLEDEEDIVFEYAAVAGTILQAPVPLSLLPPSPLNEEVPPLTQDLPADTENTPDRYQGFTFVDRKGLHWIYRGLHGADTHEDGAGLLTVQYHYSPREGFAFPHPHTGIDLGLDPDVDLPYLRKPNDNGPGFLNEPIDVRFRPVWPEVVPELRFGQTLTDPVFGLPAVRGQTSAEIIYEQSRARAANGQTRSALLFDPTRAKTYNLDPGALDDLPASALTDSRGGRTYFQSLPPHLKERFYFDPLVGPDGALILAGEYVDEIVGESYLRLNTLSLSDLEAIENVVAPGDSREALWDTAIRELATTVELFVEDPARPGSYIPSSIDEPTIAGIPDGTFPFVSDLLPEITLSDQAVDSYALTPVGAGQGFVSLVFGNGEAFTPEGEPVTVAIIRVAAPLHRGMVRPITSANPLDEQVTLQHTGDFGARLDAYQFEWAYQPPINGQAPGLDPSADNAGGGWILFQDDDLENRYIVTGTPPLLSLADNYWTMRYRVDPIDLPAHPLAGQWSEWTEPALVEGWIRRALAGLNPFNQRVTDFFNNSVNTDVSILTQAGTRWEGDIALNLQNIDEFGLIAIYETILNRGINISIDGTPSIDYGPANDALLLVTGYLNDLYTVLGNEAFADAANPTVAFDKQAIAAVADQSFSRFDEDVLSETVTSRFAFQGQVANLLDEELGLLRGRDDLNSPGVELSPTYNRFFWNYTRGINAGEVIYALNYNIRERQEDDADGTVDATDAARQYPQGHGDAYGHYLTAFKNYYRLLSDPQFTWAPRVEAVNVLGVPVQVDYFDERKFVNAAARTARTTRQIAALVRRDTHTEDRASGWAHLRDGRDPAQNFRDGEPTSNQRTRHWGLDEWTARGGQGAYFNWVVANSILPAEDTVNTGIQRIDRTTVPELDEISLTAEEIQLAADNANAFLNPLGLSAGSQLFDLSPADLAEGKTHFEQIYDRTLQALDNAFDTFDQATNSTRLIRSLENQSDDLAGAVFDQERAYTIHLREIYGRPYAGDIGPGRAYPQSYDGPDFFRWFFIDEIAEFSDPFDIAVREPVTYQLPVDTYVARHFSPTNPEEMEAVTRPAHLETIDYRIDPDSPVQFASPEMGQRREIGHLQIALQDINARRIDLAVALDFYVRYLEIFQTELDTFNEAIEVFNAQQDVRAQVRDELTGIRGTVATLKALSRTSNAVAVLGEAIREATTYAQPDNAGTAFDPSFIAAGTVGFVHVLGVGITQAISLAADASADFLEVGSTFITSDLDRRLAEAGFPAEYLRMGANLQTAWFDWLAMGTDVDLAATALHQSRIELVNLLAEGQTIQRTREIFRRRAAAITQGYRTRDVAFRAFRTEALEQYQTLLDWASRYACLAARAYDYETGLLGTVEGQEFVASIVRSRALGLRNDNGEPILSASEAGDPGLSGLLATLAGDWSSVHSRLGFNNPDQNGTVFSLRQEKFRIPGDAPGTDGDTDANNDAPEDRTWKEQLQSMILPDLRADGDVATHCLQIANNDIPISGVVIPFRSTIEDGFNFFGRPLAGGDHSFSETNFATKIHSVGVVFTGYEGMDNYAAGQSGAGAPNSHSPNALSSTPYVYLIPTGQDIMRTPPLGDTSETRIYSVHDYAIPLPFNIGASPQNTGSLFTGLESLQGNFLEPRKHQAFRAVDDPLFFYDNMPEFYTNRRLVGRSAWNTGWKLVIPANTLLHNESEGLSRFLQSVSDIKIYLRTYSYSGN